MRVPFVGGENRNRSISVSAERTVNWFMELGGKYPEGALLPRPGLKPFTNVGTGPVRGMFPFDGDLYVAATGSETER